ncbi:MAG: ATP-dependent DNA ligase [Actinobacteria bacterium]|nr:ATP-dependent DNA ligase [Actinomycetota bacterium]
MLFAEVVATSERVAGAAARRAKITELAALLTSLAPNEVEATVGFLTGRARQGRIGIGWATLGAAPAGVAGEPQLTVGDVDASLSRLCGLSGAGSRGARAAELASLFGRATAAEDDFLRRLLIGEIRQGALDGVMTDAVATAAAVPPGAVRRAVMLSGHLGRTAALALARGERGLAAVGLAVLRPLKPMLASTAVNVESAIAAGGLSSVEWKLDGARVQAHRQGKEVRLFTRSLRDVTQQLPAVVDLMRSLPVTAVVLDGELVGLREDKAPEVFQDTMSRLSLGDVHARFFDCLHLDGVDLVDLPLTDRMAALERAAGPWRVPAILTDDPAAGAAFLATALARGHEGVMVKTATSRYEAGRRGKAWRKVKPVRTLDLVVLGAEWGHGRRRGWLSNLHLGARDATGEFVMVGKTFKGLTDELLRWQTEVFQRLKRGEDGHVVFIRPEVVVEIAIDGVQRSTRYAGGVALRFARVRRYRDDKTPEEADTIDAVRAMLA